MKFLHICAGWQAWNGAANIARMLMDEQTRAGNKVSFASWAKIGDLKAADEVWVHCSWLPCLWWASLWAKRLKWMPEASYDPVRLAYHGWKKRLVGAIERFFLRRADVVVATCAAEAEWIRAYEPRVKKIEITDIKRFFNLDRAERVEDMDSFNAEVQRRRDTELHLLYLGRRHPLKGLEYLEEAVKSLEFRVQSSESKACSGNSQLTAHNSQLELRVVSNAFGDEKEKVWEWCDVLVLPTLSENFGLVVAEALERGKRVITTDGAPAWGSECKMESVKCKAGEGGIWSGYGGRLLYIKGYRNGSNDVRVESLRRAIEWVAKGER